MHNECRHIQMHIYDTYPIHFSDYCSLLINLNHEQAWENELRFKFEAWWTMEDSFESVIKRGWESTSGTMLDKMDNLTKELHLGLVY